MILAEAAASIAAETPEQFTGGDISHFAEAGEFTLQSLIAAGLQPHHRVLDIGCGALRVGYWLIDYLELDRYFGIEPREDYVALGLKHLPIDPAKRPRFDFNSDFDPSPFATRFDAFVARSIFSHASPRQIGLALDGFQDHAADGAFFLASYRRVRPKDHAPEGFTLVAQPPDRPRAQPHDSEWAKRRYTLEFFGREAGVRGLTAEPFGEVFNNQPWVLFRRA